MARKKTTIYLESDLLNATKALAASSGRREYEVVEDALRAYMSSEEVEQARQELKDLLDRVAERRALHRPRRTVRGPGARCARCRGC
jgi:hypothetical protein